MRHFPIGGELRHLFGWIPDRPDHRDIRYIPGASKAPTVVDLRNHCTAVENQGHLGACAANACTSAFEFLYAARQREPPELSRLFCYYASRVLVEQCNPREDVGAPIRSTMKALASYGCCLEVEWPYDPANYATAPPAALFAKAAKRCILWYYRIADLATIKLCLAERYPVVGGFSLPATIDISRGTGVIRFPSPREKFAGGHAVLFVGYNDNTRQLTFKNSWGAHWGNRGFGYLPYAFVTNGLASDFWTIRSAAM